MITIFEVFVSRAAGSQGQSNSVLCITGGVEQGPLIGRLHTVSKPQCFGISYRYLRIANNSNKQNNVHCAGKNHREEGLRRPKHCRIHLYIQDRSGSKYDLHISNHAKKRRKDLFKPRASRVVLFLPPHCFRHKVGSGASLDTYIQKREDWLPR